MREILCLTECEGGGGAISLNPLCVVQSKCSFNALVLDLGGVILATWNSFSFSVMCDSSSDQVDILRKIRSYTFSFTHIWTRTRARVLINFESHVVSASSVFFMVGNHQTKSKWRMTRLKIEELFQMQNPMSNTLGAHLTSAWFQVFTKCAEISGE